MGTSDRPGLSSSIFRAYDIRGVYPTELDEQDAYQIARAVFEYAKPHRVAVGRDARLSAPAVHRAVCQGFADSGCEVYDCGMTGTDVMAWASGAKDFDITINVTASHNPKEWIGMKIFSRGGIAVGGNGEIQAIGELTTKQFLDLKYRPSNTGFNQKDLTVDWVKHILSFLGDISIKPFKVVVDAGNGVAGLIVRELASHLPIQLVEMYFEPDGSFPNHLPSPIEPQNMADLQKRVVAEQADLGIAFDGDADRVFLVDGKGGIVTGSETTAVVMDQVLSEDSSRVVLYNAICGWNVRDVIAKHKALAHRVMVGHAYIRRDMKKYGAYFAGEHSGHYFFKENYNGDSGIIAAVLVLALLSKKNEPLSQVLEPHRKYCQIPETNFKVNNPKLVIQKLSERYADGAVDWLDGLTAIYPDWWLNVRLSSNEPLLRLNVEAKSAGLLQQKTDELTGLIKQLSPFSV